MHPAMPVYVRYDYGIWVHLLLGLGHTRVMSLPVIFGIRGVILFISIGSLLLVPLTHSHTGLHRF